MAGQAPGRTQESPAGPAARPEAAGEVPRALRTQAAPLPSSEAVFSQFNGQCGCPCRVGGARRASFLAVYST